MDLIVVMMVHHTAHFQVHISNPLLNESPPVNVLPLGAWWMSRTQCPEGYIN